jgi:hypothetical protein
MMVSVECEMQKDLGIIDHGPTILSSACGNLRIVFSKASTSMCTRR